MKRLFFIFVFSTALVSAIANENNDTPTDPAAETETEAPKRRARNPWDLSSRTYNIDRRPSPPPIDISTPDESICVGQPSCASIFAEKFASFTGICNNRVEGNRGKTQRTLKRFLAPDYSDKKGIPRRGIRNRPLPSTRVISSVMSNSVSQESSTASQLVPFWGQFLIHDLSLTPVSEIGSEGVECNCGHSSPDCFNIPIPRTDKQYKDEKKTCFPLKRSLSVAKDGELGCDASVRQQKNRLTAYIDVSTIYGDSESYKDSLLDPNSEIGELREQEHGFPGEKSGLLPLQSEVENKTIANEMECPSIHRPADLTCYVSGDIRANENTALVSQHTFWMRQHNSIIRRLHEINPHWERRQLFRTTRAILSAFVQRVTYEHFLPQIIGEVNMQRFGLNLLHKGYFYGYDSSHDATIANAFTTAAFRMGHSLIGPAFSRPSPTWEKDGEDITLKDSFFNTEPVVNQAHGGLNSVLRGLMEKSAQLGDTTLTDDLRNFLFAEKGHFGLDLLAINIQRGRDHGIPGYVHYRKFCGLHSPRNFRELRDISIENIKKLESLYRTVEEIDLYIGGLSEKPVEGGLVGPTFSCIIGYQFRDLKKGDRFWHENGGVFKVFTPDQLRAIQATPYPRLLCDGIYNMQSVQPQPMLKASDANPRQPCDTYNHLDVTPWRDDYVPMTNNNQHDNVDPDVEWTAWFPSSFKNGLILSSGETLSYLLQHRPAHVCHQVIDTETRVVNDKPQVRYKCMPGTIKHTDFPPVLSDDYKWSDWSDASSPSRNPYFDDDESRSKSRIKCLHPFAIQVQTQDGVPAGETGEVFESFSPVSGFVCRGIHQESRRCSNYRTRYLCRVTDVISTGNNRGYVAIFHDTFPVLDKKNEESEGTGVWSHWVSTDTQFNRGDIELLSSARRRINVCWRPIKIEARTVIGKIPVEETKERIRKMQPDYGFICYNIDQRDRRCSNYEVRYLCPKSSSRSGEGANVPSIVRSRMQQMCSLYNVCC